MRLGAIEVEELELKSYLPFDLGYFVLLMPQAHEDRRDLGYFLKGKMVDVSGCPVFGADWA